MYVGGTNDLELRMHEHKTKMATDFTKKHVTSQKRRARAPLRLAK